MTIEQYLEQITRLLPRVGRGRILAEIEDHLRAAARDGGDEAAVARFGSPAEIARTFRPSLAALWTRIGALGVVAALLSYPVLYPIPENTLPPAPWPEGAMPSHLDWKQDAVRAALLVAVGATAVGALRFRRADGGLLSAVAVALAALAVSAVVGIILSFEWAEAVPGTPGWLVLLGFGQLALVAAAGGALARALVLRYS